MATLQRALDFREKLSETLRQASLRDQPVVPWGAGTLQRLGAKPPASALTLRTTALDRIVEYHPPDLTITVEAGVALETLDALLAEQGQWLPWLPPARAPPRCRPSRPPGSDHRS